MRDQLPRLQTLSVRKTVRDILSRKRRENPTFKDPSSGLFKSKKAKQKASDVDTWTFHECDKSLALREAVEESGHVGVARELIDMGADVNFLKQASKPKLKGFRSDRFEVVPFNFAKIAATRNHVEMVSLLAARGASPANLVEALEQAVRHNLPNVVATLLRNGTDPNARDGSIITSAVASQDPALVRLLLRAHKKIDKRWLTSNLPTAVLQGQTEIVSLLVTYGADTDFECASALRKAVQAQRIDLVLAVLKRNANSQTASSVFDVAFSSNSSLTVPEQYLLIEILLCAGAKGDNVAKILTPVVQAGHRSICKLLIMHGADPQFNKGEALKTAVKAANAEILSILLLGNTTTKAASSMIDEVPYKCNDDLKCELMTLLITKGAKGISLHRALVHAVQQKDKKTIGLLLDHQASVDFEEAQALRMAVTGGNLAIVNLLLSKGRPQPSLMQLVLPLVPQSPPEVRYGMTKSVISVAGQNGIPTNILNNSLLEAAGRPTDHIDNGLIDVLITAGAKVDCKCGKIFRLAAEHGSTEMLELLIRTVMEPTSLSAAVPVSMRIKVPSSRRHFIAILLDRGAQGPDVDQAFVDAIEERPMDIFLVQTLLEKANVRYHGGRALSAAIQCPTIDVAAAIIDTGRTDEQSRLTALPIVFLSGTIDRIEKLNMLLRAGVGQQGLNECLVREISGERDVEVVNVLIEHGASCAHDGGKSLELAIRFHDNSILNQLVASSGEHPILQDVIKSATKVQDVAWRRTSMSALLKGGARGDQVSEALVKEILRPHHRDFQLIQLLVNYGARIDYANARAIKHVVSSSLDVDLLKVLVSGTAASTVVSSLVLLAMAHDQDSRLPLLQVLLENGACGDDVNAALVKAVSEGVKAQATILLLLKFNASVNYQQAEAVKVAALAGSDTILDCLLSNSHDPKYLPEALRLAMHGPKSRSRTNASRRLHSVRILTRSRITKPEAMHSALIQAVQEKDYDLIEHFIKHGADPNFRDGMSVVTAARQSNIKSLHLLARSKPTWEVYSHAFAVVPRGIDRWHQQPDIVQTLDNILISGGANGPAVDETLVVALISSHASAAKFVGMILSCKTVLDVNFDGGRSLCIAVKRALFELVRYFLSLKPNDKTLRTAFMAIFESNANERILISMLHTFFEHSKLAKHIYFQQDDPLNNPLYQTLHRHPDKPDMLQTLLDHGCRTGSKFSWTFDSKIGPEEVSPLLWLLCQGDEGIESRTVKIVLAHACDPDYRTSHSGNAPLTVAAASLQSGIVLQLLEEGAEPNNQDGAGGTPLLYATNAGNLESMGHLLKYQADYDDESLHIAARQLHVNAVKLLLDQGASTILPGTVHCSSRIPLGELCRLANSNESPAQLKKALKVLCNATSDLQMLANGKSLVLLALDNDSPLVTTRALLASCQKIQLSLNNDFNLYSKDTLRYSPISYVRHFKCITPFGHRSVNPHNDCCTLDTCPAPDLEKPLHAYGCHSRFWDDVAGANQPQGACGLPPAVIAVQKEAKKARRERDEQARMEAAEKARRDAIQADLNAAAKADRKRERERLALLEEERAAEIRLGEERSRAELRIQRQRAAAKDAEFAADRERERREFSDEQERNRLNAQAEERRLKEKARIHNAHKREEAAIAKEMLDREKGLLKEKKALLNSAKGLMKQAEHSRVGGGSMGRILGEIEN